MPITKCTSLISVVSLIILLFSSADALNNLAGFGFSGYNDNGEAKWDLTENVNIAGVEVSGSTLTFDLSVGDYE